MSDEEEVGTAVIRLRVDESGVDEAMDRAAAERGRRGSETAARQGRQQGDLQGDAFSRALKIKLEAAMKSLPEVRLRADSSDAENALLRINSELRELSEKNIGVDISAEDAEAKIAELNAELKTLSKDRDIRVRVNASEASAALSALEKQFGATGLSGKKAIADIEKEFHPLLALIVTVGPALVPLAGGLLAASTAAVGFGAAGIAAMVGVKKEIKDNTALGQQFVTQWDVLRDSLAGVEHTAAQGILPGFGQIVDKLTLAAPQLNITLGKSSQILGDMASHIVGGLVAGFETWTPLIEKAEHGADALSRKFEDWAKGDGGEAFMRTLSDDLDQIGPALGALAETVVHLISAIGPAGSTSLQTITLLSEVINDIPVGVLQAATVAFVAYKTAVIATAPFELAAKALRGFAAAETEAAVAGAAAGTATRLTAGARAASALALGLRAAVPWAATIIGVEFAANAAAKATDSWASSTNTLRAVTGQTAHVVKDLLTLNFKDINPFLDQKGAQRVATQSARNDIANVSAPAILQRAAFSEPQYKADQATLQRYQVLFAVYNKALESSQALVDKSGGKNQAAAEAVQKYANLAYDANQHVIDQRAKLAGGDPLANATAQINRFWSEAQTVSNNYLGTIDNVNQATHKYVLTQLDQGGAISKSSEAYDSLNKNLQKQINAEKTWTDATGENTVTVQGNKYSTDAYNAALQQTGGNIVAAEGLLRGHRAALESDRIALAAAVEEQNNINAAYGQAQTALNLTTDQLDLYSSAIGITASELASGSISSDQFTKAMGAVKDQLLDANTANAAWLASLDQFNKSGKTAADTASLIGAAFAAGRGYALDYAGANLSAATASEAGAAALSKYKDSISDSGELLGQLTKTSKGYQIIQPKLTEGSLAIAQALQQQASSAQTAAEQTYQNEVRTKGAKVAASDALGVYQGYRSELIKQATQSGLSAGAAQHLANKYLGIPKDVKTFIKQIGAHDINVAVSHLTTAINHLDKDIRIQLGLDGLPGTIAGLSAVQRKQADIINQGGLVSTHGYTRAGADGFVMSYYANGGFNNANRPVEKFAGGGEHHVAEVAPVGTTRVWNEPETGGEAYIPLAASKRARSRAILSDVADRFGMETFANGGVRGGGSSAGGDTPAWINDLIAAITALSDRPVLLKANGSTLAKVVMDQTARLNRRN